MKIAIHHQLSIANPPGAARMALHLLLCPRSGGGQTVESWLVDAEGMAEAARFTDAYGNSALLLTRSRPAETFAITVSGTVNTADRHGVVGRLDGEPVPALFRRITPLTRSNVTLFGKFRAAPRGGGDRIGLLHQLMARVREFYALEDEGAAGPMQAQPGQIQAQPGETPARSEDGRKPATARDFAHAFIGAARALDIPARYVTGYLAGTPERAASAHAWAEAWDEGLGWIGFDAALGLCPTDRHVRLAVGLDAASAAPVRAAPAGEPASLSVRIEAAQ